jgi:hypothetical protein
MKTSPRNLSQRLVLYGLGAGAVSVASQADAVVKSGPVEFSGDTIHFDLQNVSPPSSASMPNDDFAMKSNCTKSKAKIKGQGNFCPTIGASIRSSRPYAYKLFANNAIGTQSFSRVAYFNDINSGPPDNFGNNAGDWKPGDRGFLALRLIINGDAFYGWADVTLKNLDCNGPVFTLHRYAFNTDPNETILAGETRIRNRKRREHIPPPTNPCASPTPSATSIRAARPDSMPSGVAAAAIGLLIAGAAGVTTLKKQRKNSMPS